jgi:hypothetical protein
MTALNQKKTGTLPAKESVAEMQALIKCQVQEFSGCKNRQQCMIRSLSGLTFASLQTLVKGFKRELCVDILKGECACRKQAANKKK